VKGEEKMKKMLIVAAACVAVMGCGNMTKGKSAAESEVQVFHERFNEEEFAAIVDAAHPNMLKGSSGSETADFLSVVRSKLGKVTGSKTANWNVRTFNAITTVVLVKNTTFEQGKGTETFTFRIKGGKASLLDYNINSRDLIMK